MYLLNLLKLIYRPKSDEIKAIVYLEILGRIEGLYIEYNRFSIHTNKIYRISYYNNSRKHGETKIFNDTGKIRRIEKYNKGELVQTILMTNSTIKGKCMFDITKVNRNSIFN